MYTVYCKFQFGNTKYNFTIYNIQIRKDEYIFKKLTSSNS